MFRQNVLGSIVLIALASAVGACGSESVEEASSGTTDALQGTDAVRRRSCVAASDTVTQSTTMLDGDFPTGFIQLEKHDVPDGNARIEFILGSMGYTLGTSSTAWFAGVGDEYAYRNDNVDAPGLQAEVRNRRAPAAIRGTDILCSRHLAGTLLDYEEEWLERERAAQIARMKATGVCNVLARKCNASRGDAQGRQIGSGATCEFTLCAKATDVQRKEITETFGVTPTYTLVGVKSNCTKCSKNVNPPPHDES